MARLLFLRLGALLPLAVVAGCNLIPDFATPAVPVPSAWIEDKMASNAPAWPERDWWRAFGSPVLDRLIETAQANNTDIGAAAARVLQADAQIQIARSPLFPSVDGSLDATRTGQFSSSGTSTTARRNFTVTNSFGAALNASYELDFFGRNRSGLTSAEASATFSRFDRDTVALTVVANVATTHFDVIQLRDRLAVARRNLAIAESVLAVVEARVRNGAASPLDLAQQRTIVASQRATIPALETQVRQAENALATLLGTHPGAIPPTTGTLLDIVPPPIQAGLPSELLIRRPDIQAAEAQLVAANAEIGAARAAFFPSIQLTGERGQSSATFANLLDPLGRSFQLATGLTIPIFAGGRLTGERDLAEARRAELVQAYRSTVITAFADVENALVAARRSTEQESLQAEAVEQARLGYELAEARYRAGAVDLLVVLDAQRTLYQAEDQLAQIRFARLEAAVALFRALGGGWDLDAAGGGPARR